MTRIVDQGSAKGRSTFGDLASAVTNPGGPHGSPNVDLVDLGSVTERVELLLVFIRQARIDTGWTFEALASEMRLDKAYIERVLSGGKPLNARFLVALPRDIAAIVVRRYAETFGMVVVMPANGDEALRQFTAGLLGLFGAAQMPAKAGAQLKATLDAKQDRRRA